VRPATQVNDGIALGLANHNAFHVSFQTKKHLNDPNKRLSEEFIANQKTQRSAINNQTSFDKS
jgi:hypothetical protein